MGLVRRTICLICALALATSGLYILSLLIDAHGKQGLIAVTGSGLLSVGLYWLWVDFIKADPHPEADK